jgi:RNA polymerase sigma-70 factor (ECF subfamily)
VIEISDIELMERIANKDGDALQDLFARYGRRSFALSYRITNNASAAEEVVQDAFQTVWQKCHQFDVAKGGNVRGWLLTIVHRKSIDYRRREIDKRPADIPIEDMEWSLSVPDVTAEVDQRLLQERVRAALNDLPAEQRQVIELAYFEGMSQSDIASARGMPLGTGKSRMRLGMRKLSETLRSEWHHSGTTPGIGGRP